jgi:alkylation response protein AidB-like acyl-CoA dehydrogenase
VARAERIAREVAAPAATAVDREGRFPSEAMSALAQGGFYGLLLPREHGGLGEGARALCGVVEALSEACGSTAMIYIMHSLAARAIAAAPALANKEPLLRDIANGKLLCTLAYSEETSRSNFWVQGSELRAEGDAYVLDAMKTWVTSAGHAAINVVAARRPGATVGTDFTVFLVRDDPKTVRVRGAFDGLGLRGNASCPVQLEGYRVPAGDLMTAHGDGREFTGKTLVPFFDLSTAAMSHGLCRAAVALTAEHLRATRLHGGALRDLPTLRARVAEMAVCTEQSRALLGHALDHLDRPSPAARFYFLATRQAAINAAITVTDLAMKACGGAAFRKEVGVERLFRDARAGWVMGPTSDVLAEMIGRELTGLEPL